MNTPDPVLIYAIIAYAHACASAIDRPVMLQVVQTLCETRQPHTIN